ncbi:MAG: RNA polymerase sigma factor [Acidimicrobiales bacterium]
MQTSITPHLDGDRQHWVSVSQQEEAALVAGLCEGQEASYETLVQRHQIPMVRLARSYVANEASAEDIVQETWLAVLRGIERFDGRSSLKTWIYCILTNRAKTAGRRESRAVPVSTMPESENDNSERAIPRSWTLGDRYRECTAHWKGPGAPWERSIEDHVVATEAVAVALRAIEALPRTQRLVITLRDVECWSALEVCDVLALSETNQRVLLHRARAKIRAHLEECDGTSRAVPPRTPVPAQLA